MPSLIEPGMEFAPPAFRQAVEKEVKEVLDAIYATHGNGAWKKKIMINDRIADSIFQQIVTRPEEYSVLATPNLNGDYISDAARRRWAALESLPARTSATAMRSSKPRTAPRRNMPIKM